MIHTKTNQWMKIMTINSCNIFMELGILKSVVEKIGTCPEWSSRLRIKMLPEEHQVFANKLNILCEQCIWTDEFYSSSVISPKATDLLGKRPFNVNTTMNCCSISWDRSLQRVTKNWDSHVHKHARVFVKIII